MFTQRAFLGQVFLAGSPYRMGISLQEQLARCARMRRTYGQQYEYWVEQGEAGTAQHYRNLFDEADKSCKRIQRMIEQAERTGSSMVPPALPPSAQLVRSSKRGTMFPSLPFGLTAETGMPGMFTSTAGAAPFALTGPIRISSLQRRF